MRATAREAAEAGAALVFGHGPHVLRGVEIIDRTLVLYSLGNLWTGRGISTAGLSGVTALVEVEFDDLNGFRCAEVISLIGRRTEPPRIDPSAQALTLMRRLSESSDFADMLQDNGVIRSIAIAQQPYDKTCGRARD
jgi:hypothetical protein